MCNECMKECIGVTPCGKCAVLIEGKENRVECGDILAIVAVVVVCYLWAIVG